MGLLPYAPPCAPVAVPKSEDGLRRALGEAHRRYTRLINFREGWRGHLWQGRFSSFVMDEKVSSGGSPLCGTQPVRARLVEERELYRWSSAAAQSHPEGSVPPAGCPGRCVHSLTANKTTIPQNATNQVYMALGPGSYSMWLEGCTRTRLRSRSSRCAPTRETRPQATLRD